MSFSDVSNILWRERQLLELLVFKLEVEQMLLATGRTRWLSHATNEIEMVIGEVKQAELARALEVQRVCEHLGVDDVPTLRALVELAPLPWHEIFEEHRKAFLEATQEIVGLAESNRELLARGYQSARDALASLGGDRVQTYTAEGRTTVRTGAARLVDEVL